MDAPSKRQKHQSSTPNDEDNTASLIESLRSLLDGRDDTINFQSASDSRYSDNAQNLQLMKLKAQTAFVLNFFFDRRLESLMHQQLRKFVAERGKITAAAAESRATLV
jgi:hypothetical protein